MPYALIRTSKLYVGNSDDVKPILKVTDRGARLYEADTRFWYWWNGSEWLAVDGLPEQA